MDVLREIFVDDQHLFNQFLRNHIRFGNVNQVGLGVVFRRSGTADNLLRREIMEDVCRFHRIILVALVYDDDEGQPAVFGVSDMLQKIGALAVLQGVVALLRQLLPVDETSVVFLKAGGHHICQQFGVAERNVLVHLGLALLLQVALAGGQPDKDLAKATLAVLVHKVGQDDGLAAAGAAFQNDLLLWAGHGLH